MGRVEKWIPYLIGRVAMYSPVAPSLRQEVKRQSLEQVATKITSEQAAAAIGVSQAVGARRFRRREGMQLFMAIPVSARYLSLAEREEIGLLSAQEIGVREITRCIGRSASQSLDNLRLTLRLGAVKSSIAHPLHSGRLNCEPRRV